MIIFSHLFCHTTNNLSFIVRTFSKTLRDLIVQKISRSLHKTGTIKTRYLVFPSIRDFCFIHGWIEEETNYHMVCVTQIDQYDNFTDERADQGAVFYCPCLTWQYRVNYSKYWLLIYITVATCFYYLSFEEVSKRRDQKQATVQLK